MNEKHSHLWYENEIMAEVHYAFRNTTTVALDDPQPWSRIFWGCDMIILHTGRVCDMIRVLKNYS